MINLPDYINKSKLFQTIEVDNLVAVRYECFINEERSDIWSHTNYFAFVESGQKRWKSIRNDSKVNPGDILFVKKGSHTVYQYFNAPFYVVFIFVDDLFIKNTVLEYQEDGVMHISPNQSNDDLILLDQSELLKSFQSSFRLLFSENINSSKALLRLKVKELILSLLTQSGNDRLKSYFYSLNIDKNSLLEQTMNTHFHQSLSIAEFAMLCARSLSAFRRDFEHVFKTTPGKWLIERRIAYSRVLLESTDKPINEVADLCGFKNRSHFLKRFRDKYHVSPRKYREVSKIAL